MAEPDPLPRGLTEVAAEPAEESVTRERELLGDEPDHGGVVPEDDAQ